MRVPEGSTRGLPADFLTWTFLCECVTAGVLPIVYTEETRFWGRPCTDRSLVCLGGLIGRGNLVSASARGVVWLSLLRHRGFRRDWAQQEGSGVDPLLAYSTAAMLFLHEHEPRRAEAWLECLERAGTPIRRAVSAVRRGEKFPRLEACFRWECPLRLETAPSRPLVLVLAGGRKKRRVVWIRGWTRRVRRESSFRALRWSRFKTRPRPRLRWEDGTFRGWKVMRVPRPRRRRTAYLVSPFRELAWRGPVAVEPDFDESTRVAYARGLHALWPSQHEAVPPLEVWCGPWGFDALGGCEKKGEWGVALVEVAGMGKVVTGRLGFRAQKMMLHRVWVEDAGLAERVRAAYHGEIEVIAGLPARPILCR